MTLEEKFYGSIGVLLIWKTETASRLRSGRNVREMITGEH